MRPITLKKVIKNDFYTSHPITRPGCLRSAYVEWARGFENPVAVTLTTNHGKKSRNNSWNTPTAPTSEKRLYEFDTRVFKRLYGNKANSKNVCFSTRAYGFFCLEKLHSNPHLHGIVDIRCIPVWEYGSMVEAAWSELSPGGSVNVQACYSTEGWVNYMLKEYSNEDLKGRKQPMLVPKPRVSISCRKIGCRNLKSCRRNLGLAL